MPPLKIHYILENAPGDGLHCWIKTPGKKGFMNSFPIKGVTQAGTMAQVSPEDRPILMGLYMLQGIHSDSVRLNKGQSSILLKKMVQTCRCHWHGAQNPPLTWGTEELLELAWMGDAQSGYQPEIRPHSVGLKAFFLEPPIYLNPDIGCMGPLVSDLPDGLRRAWKSEDPLLEAGLSRFLQQLTQSFPNAEIPSPEGSLGEILRDVDPVPRLDLRLKTRISKQGKTRTSIEAHLGWLYNDDFVEEENPSNFIHAIRQDRRVRIARNWNLEADWCHRLEAQGFQRSPDVKSHWECPAKAIQDGDIAGHLDRLHTSMPAAVLTWKGLERIRKVDPQELYWEARSKSQHAEVDFGIRYQDQKVTLIQQLADYLGNFQGQSLEAIRESLQHSPPLLHLPEDEVIFLPWQKVWRLVETLFEILSPNGVQKNGRIRLSSWRLAEMAHQVENFRLPDSLREQTQNLRNLLAEGLQLQSLEAPAQFPASLRDYQRTGLGWLDFLMRHGMNGILADDMGLGKTIQTLAHILREKEAGRLTGPVLVVVPASVVHNWVREARRFTPELSVLIWGGKERSALKNRLAKSDLVISTYNLMRIDNSRLASIHWAMLILDEAQFIKNPASRVAQAARKLPAGRRLCLTGTPMENHLGELWSLFHFLLPGYLGSEAEFKEQFRKPIEQLALPDRLTFLQRRISPFILRRTKDEVAKELPPKTEVLHYIDLTPKQVEVYEAIRLAMETRVSAGLKEAGLNRTRLLVLEALLKLRQVCCDPRLLVEAHEADSSKLRALMEWLPDLVEEGRRILIFSQFTSVLKLIEEALKKAGLHWVKLTGSTRDRASVIDPFQSGQVPIFLISLKAGGFGLNLTRADTVIHYDPWWNPAVESQATDRAHRIGQDKPVFVYKLITRGTVEERILQLQNRKRDLTGGILEGAMKEVLQLNTDEIQWLLSGLERSSDYGLPSDSMHAELGE